ncbi:DNA polymerase III subunit beta [Pajaroellobacter abortibovis]|uniref:Beta sliding clamp n=1 Tax=Pajaroellobacter abortibovis TaxID=1882918 RepID=A0A1L6MUN4_9BACT|nr:DNA polymerase III subunit beta [Pajaroellobacter abortibovis]APR99232.1 DNA polymerase III subunit beta [Pajaroellobacter abortibovis]
MEFTVSKRELLRLMARMHGVAERKSTMTILSNVFVLAREGNVHLSATDLYLGVTGRTAAEVTKEGKLAVSARDFLERIKMMPEGPLQILTQDHSALVIKGSGTARRYTLRGIPGDDFPRLPSPSEGAEALTIGAQLFGELISKTYFSASVDETRAHLNSALFEWENDTVRMVSTDGHRLSKMEMKVGKQTASARARMLIPLKALHELRRLCEDVSAGVFQKEGSKSDQKGLISIMQSQSNAFFEGSGVCFSVKLVDAQFPPYTQVIPKTSSKKFVIRRATFAEALRAVSIAAGERIAGVKLVLNAGTVRILSESPEGGDGLDELPIEYGGPSITVGFNAKYFLDVLTAMNEEEVEVLLNGELDPALIQPVGDKDCVFVIMPMRV